MNLPIYSSLKAKLESKGLDSTTSGQIAWFVCSVGIFIIPMLYLYFTNDNNQLIILFFMFFIFVFNLLYIVNVFPFSLVIAFIWIHIVYSYNFREIIYILVAAFMVLVLICFILKKWRLLITFCFGMAFIFFSIKLFQMLGGLVK